MPALFACHGGAEPPLKAHLRRATESKATELQMELLSPILDATYDSDCRREIMRHLRECLSEPTGKRWHRILAALLLVEKLLDKGPRCPGSHSLVVELAHGHHFDLIQKVSLLEHFDAHARGVVNPWAQPAVRAKAAALRTTLVPLLESASLEELPPDAGLIVKDSVSSCSLGGASTTTGASASTRSTLASSTCSSVSPLGITPSAARSGILARMKRPRPVAGCALGEDFDNEALSTSSCLRSDLASITRSKLIDMPPEWFTFAVEASRELESQKRIRKHLRKIFAQPHGRWRPIYVNLCLIENVLDRGSPHFLIQAPHGRSHGLVRQLWFLQEFEYRKDYRAQSLVRKKSAEVHGRLIELLTGSAEFPVEDVAAEDDFADLRHWAGAFDSDLRSEASSRPSTCTWSSGDLSYAGHDERRADGLEPAFDCKGRNPRTSARRSDTSSDSSDAGWSDDEDTKDTFFTPMQTPAIGRAMPRPSHLLSL